MSGRARRIGAAIVVAAAAFVAWWLVRESAPTTNAVAPASASAPAVGTRGTARAARARTEAPADDATTEAAPAGGSPATMLARFRVTSSDGRAPIAGARLELADASDDSESVSLVTGSDGTARMPDARKWSSFRVVARARGFAMGELELHASACVDEIALGLLPGTDVAGRVVDDASGDPIAGAAVRAFGDADVVWSDAWHDSRESEVVVGRATTDATGAFRLEDLPVRPHGAGVVVSAAFHMDESLTCDTLPPPEPLVVRLEPAGRVRGVVRWSDGTPVAGAAVSAEQQTRVDGSDGSAGTFADDEGRFVVEGLRLGVAYELRAHAQAYVPTAPVDVVTTTPGAREVVHDLVLRRPATITVFVHAPDGTPAPWAQVAACRPGPFRREIPVHAGAAGAVLDRVEPGAVTVHAWSDDWADTTADVVVGDGETRTLTITLRPLFAIEGVVVDDGGAPVAGAHVRTIDGFGCGQQPTATTESGADGTFALSLRSGGEHSVEANALDHVTSSGNAVPGGAGLRIVLARQALVRLRLRPPPEGAERLVLWEFVDAEGATIGSGVDRRGPAESDWTMRAPLTARRLRVGVAGFVPVVVAVEPVFGKTTDLGDVTLDRGAGVVGRVVACDGESADGETVEVDSADGERHVVSGPLGKDGEFAFHGLAPQSVLIHLRDGAYLDPAAIAEARADPTPITITLRSGCLLAVRVVDADGLAALNVRVDALAADGTPSPGAFEMVKAGTYARRVPPGRWRLVATRGDLRAEQTVDASEGATRDVALRLGR